MVKYFVVLLIVGVTVLGGCVKDKEVTPPLTRNGCDSGYFSFRQDIFPIFQRNCNNIGCHSRQDGGELDFSNYNLVKDLVNSGAMSTRLSLPVTDPKHMPKDRVLGTCELYTIKTWIAQGGVE